MDGVNLKDIDLSYVRKNVGVVSQEPSLFATTIAENIRYGKLDASMEEIGKTVILLSFWGLEPNSALSCIYHSHLSSFSEFFLFFVIPTFILHCSFSSRSHLMLPSAVVLTIKYFLGHFFKQIIALHMLSSYFD